MAEFVCYDIDSTQNEQLLPQLQVTNNLGTLPSYQPTQRLVFAELFIENQADFPILYAASTSCRVIPSENIKILGGEGTNMNSAPADRVIMYRIQIRGLTDDENPIVIPTKKTRSYALGAIAPGTSITPRYAKPVGRIFESTDSASSHVLQLSSTPGSEITFSILSPNPELIEPSSGTVESGSLVPLTGTPTEGIIQISASADGANLEPSRNIVLALNI